MVLSLFMINFWVCLHFVLLTTSNHDFHPFFSNFYRPFLPVFRQLLNMVLIHSSIFTTSNHVSGTIICFVSICLAFFNNQKIKQSLVLIVDIFIKTVPQPPQNLIAIKLMLYSPQHQFEKCRKTKRGIKLYILTNGRF